MRIKIVLKSKINGKIQDIYPPVSNPQNGLIDWPVDTDEWEVLSVHGCSGIEVENFFDRAWLVYEGDELTVDGINFEVKFKEGMYCIEVGVDRLNFLSFTVLKPEYLSLYKELQNNNKPILIPMAHLNFNAKFNGEKLITLKSK